MKGTRSALLLLVALLAAASAVCLPGSASAETVIRDLSGIKIIKSHEAPHNILGEACVACHPRERFEFWLLIYKGKPPSLVLEGARDNAAGAGSGVHGAGTGGAARPPNRYNSHEAMACSFCHFENPRADSPRFIVEIGSLCLLCHPGTVAHRLPESDGLARVTAAVGSGKLPGIDGKIACTTCHKLHEATYSMRESYFRVIYEGRVPNPHGDRSLCFGCHPGSVREGSGVRLAAKDPIELCNGCHTLPGVPQAPHVAGVGPGNGTWKMEYLGYPLAGGKLTCVTCHEEPSHDRRDPANPRFLRGGPYPDQEKFCSRCHLESAEQRNNPHRQLDGFGRIRAESCRFCHKTVPDESSPESPESTLVGDEAAVCSNCHKIGPHPGVDHMIPITAKMDARRQEYERRHEVRIPLGKGGTIACSTCHNPHAKGVIKGKAGVGASSLWRVPDFREVCAPCHGRY